MERRFSAILAADVAGYSTRMEAAEEATAMLLSRCQKTIMEITEKLGGRVFNTAGDSAMAEFSSPVNAVRAGVEILRANRREEMEEGASLPLRIGVHLADVIVSGADLLGDGVNLAARIQQKAEPSTVFASQAVFEHVRRHSPFVFEDAGLHSLKNIGEKMRLYRVAGDMKPHRYEASHVLTRPADRDLRPGSIAVLPFEVGGGDEEQRYLAEGVTDDLIVELSRFRNLFVSSHSSIAALRGETSDPQAVGRQLGVRHLLVGQVRRQGPRMRISVRLVDAADGATAWAERYDRAMDEIFDVMDDVVSKIAATLVGKVEAAGIAEARRKHPNDLSAYDHLLRGLERHRLGGVTTENAREAASWFEKAIAADPDYSLPYAWWVCSASWLPDFDSQKGLRYINKAIELDENNPEAHRIMGSYQTWLGNFEAARHHYNRAISLNPSNAYIRARTAAFHTFNGEPELSLELVDQAEALDPFLPVWCVEERGVALFNLGRHSEAVSAFEQLAFQTFRSRCYVAASLAAMGETERARKAVKEALSIQPGQTMAGLMRTETYREPERAERLQDLLKLAGMPLPAA